MFESGGLISIDLERCSWSMGKLLSVLPFWLLSTFLRFYNFVNTAPGHLCRKCQACKKSEAFGQNTCCVFGEYYSRPSGGLQKQSFDRPFVWLDVCWPSLLTSIVGFFNNLIFCEGCEILCSDNIVCMVTVQKLASDSNWLGKCRSVGQILAQSNHWHLLNHDSSATQGSITLLVSVFIFQQGPSNCQKWQ